MLAKRIFRGFLVGSVTVILPALGNPSALAYPQLWMLLILGILCSCTQPSPPNETSNSETTNQKHEKDFDGRSAQQIFLAIWVTQVWAVCEAVYLRFPEAFQWGVVPLAALVCDLAGIGLRVWAVRELGRFFSWRIQVASDHAVVKSGPYKWVRHPSYTGAMLAYLSSIAFLQAWYSFTVAVVLYTLVFMNRIRREERMLVEKLGSEYKNYKNQVKALIPFVL